MLGALIISAYLPSSAEEHFSLHDTPELHSTHIYPYTKMGQFEKFFQDLDLAVSLLS